MQKLSLWVKMQTVITDADCYAVQVNPDMVSQLESAGLSFVGKDETGRRMEVCIHMKMQFNIYAKIKL